MLFIGEDLLMKLGRAFHLPPIIGDKVKCSMDKHAAYVAHVYEYVGNGPIS